MEKKLITDNPAIKEVSFYNPNNIFIWDGSNAKDIPNFLSTEYDTAVNKYKKDYDVFAWFDNFFK